MVRQGAVWTTLGGFDPARISSTLPEAVLEMQAASSEAEGRAIREALKRTLAGGPSSAALPRIPQPPPPTSRGSRSRARWRRALEVWLAAEGVRKIVNELAGVSGAEGRPRARRLRVQEVKVEEPLMQSVAALLREVGRVRRARRAAMQTGAVPRQVLTKQKDETYSGLEGEVSTYVPVVSDLISEPEEYHGTSMLSLMPAADVEIFRNLSRLLIPKHERDKVLASMNFKYRQVVRGPRSEYIKYFHRQDVRGLWELKKEADVEARCAFAVVRKSDGVHLRKILAVCPFNAVLRPLSELYPPGVEYGMQGAAALAQVDVAAARPSIDTLDESVAFTHLEVPHSWRRFQGAPRLKAKELPSDWAAAFEPEDWLVPCY